MHWTAIRVVHVQADEIVASGRINPDRHRAHVGDIGELIERRAVGSELNATARKKVRHIESQAAKLDIGDQRTSRRRVNNPDRVIVAAHVAAGAH